MKTLYVFTLLLFLSTKSFAIKYPNLTPEEKAEAADYIGFIQIKGGKITQDTPLKIQYRISEVDPIKVMYSSQVMPSLQTDCGLNMMGKYLIYAVYDKEKNILKSDCIKDIFRSQISPKSYSQKVIVPSITIQSIPLKNIQTKAFCPFFVNDACESVTPDTIVDYQALRSALGDLIKTN